MMMNTININDYTLEIKTRKGSTYIINFMSTPLILEIILNEFGFEKFTLPELFSTIKNKYSNELWYLLRDKRKFGDKVLYLVKLGYLKKEKKETTGIGSGRWKYYYRLNKDFTYKVISNCGSFLSEECPLIKNAKLRYEIAKQKIESKNAWI